MAFGTNTGERRPVVFLELRTNAKEPTGVGFRQVLSKTPNPDTTAKSKWLYETAMHQFVEGRIAGFRVKEEPSYDDPTIMIKVGQLRLEDDPKPGAEAGPDVIVSFRLDSQHGRNLVGLITNALQTEVPVLHIKTNRGDIGDKIGDTVLDAPRAYVTANKGSHSGPRIAPAMYIDPATMRVRADESGEVAKLPRGIELTVNKKKVWDFTDADTWVEQTAAVLQAAFEESPPDEHAEGDGSGHASGDDHGVNLEEAAAAAAPQA